MPRTRLAEGFLEIGSKTCGVNAAAPCFAIRAALVTIAAEELFLGFYISEARNINSVGAITEFVFVFVAGNDAVGAAAHDVIHKVAAKLAAGIGETIGKFRSRGVQQNTRGFKGRGVKKKDAAAKFERFLGLAVNHAHAGNFPRAWVKDQAVDHTVRAESHAAGFFSRGQRGIQAAEIGAGNAPAVTNSAVVARSAATMDARQYGGTPDGHHAAIVETFWQSVFDHEFGTGHFHGREEFAVGQLRQTFGLAAYSYEILSVLVPGLDVLVADGPIGGDSVAYVGFEIQVAKTIALTAPHDGLAANLAAANPGEWLVRVGDVGGVEIVDKKFAGVFITRVITLALNFLSSEALVTIIPAAILQLPRGNMLDVVLFRNDRATGFQQ